MPLCILPPSLLGGLFGYGNSLFFRQLLGSCVTALAAERNRRWVFALFHERGRPVLDLAGGNVNHLFGGLGKSLERLEGLVMWQPLASERYQGACPVQ